MVHGTFAAGKAARETKVAKELLEVRGEMLRGEAVLKVPPPCSVYGILRCFKVF